MLESIADGQTLRASGARPVALGWATVELDRAASELGAALGLHAGRYADAAPSPALGARCRLAINGFDDGIDLVLLEPSTEGRLAAILARHDEGPAAVWFGVDSLPAAIVILRRLGLATTVVRRGPLGSERLLLGGPIHGPHRLVVERPGTIRA